jgi:hypothetical protein
VITGSTSIVVSPTLGSDQLLPVDQSRIGRGSGQLEASIANAKRPRQRNRRGHYARHITTLSPRMACASSLWDGAFSHALRVSCSKFSDD